MLFRIWHHKLAGSFHDQRAVGQSWCTSIPCANVTGSLDQEMRTKKTVLGEGKAQVSVARYLQTPPSTAKR